MNLQAHAIIAYPIWIIVDLSLTLQKAMDHHQKGENTKAVELYKKFLSDGGKDKRAYTNLSALLRSEDNPEEAMQIARRGLKETDENSPILLNTLGNCLRDLNRNCEAITAYKKSLKNHGDYFDPQISIVGILYDIRNYRT